MLAICFFLAIFLVSVCSENNTLYYDSFRGARINETKILEHVRKNTTFWCVTKFKPCDPDEPRRIDGTCNSLENPTRGASHTPFYRVLPPIYEEENKVFEPRTAEDGHPLPPPRPLRTSFLPVGRVPDQVFTQLATHYIVFTVADVVSLHDTVNYILWTPHCCDAKGKTDKTCVSMKVPDDDPVHRFSNVRCLNLTRPDTFQSQKCIENGTAPERIISSTPLVDLSHMYGNDLEALEKKGRKFEGGLLKYEEADGRIWPPSTTGPVDLCLLNAHPVETRCHNTPEDGTNTLIGINLGSIWLWRMHNRIASALSEINSCWDDDQLFYKARDINIAISTQILYYELLPLLMGRNNLILDNVIASSPTFRDIYNETEIPQVSLEYPFVLRWFHMMQEGELRMYDTDGHYLKQFPVVNLTLKTGYLAVDDNLDWITQGSFRQPSAKIDYVVDPDIADLVLGPHQRASDVFASDLSKNRLFGFQPYVKYLEFCFNRPYKSFNDLAELFDPERLELLRDKYKHVNDIDLMAGMWLEKPKDGGFIPPTLYCLMTDQLLRNIVADRHWYERPNRPHAFTLEQLLEIRKSSISALLCEVGDTVTEIQPSGFLRAGPRNEIDSCDLLPKIDFNAWKDESCDRDRRRRRSNY